MTSMVSASDKSARFTSFSIASRIFMARLLFFSPDGGKGVGKILLVPQSLDQPVRVLTSAIPSDTDAVPKPALVIHLGHIGVVALVLEPINPDLGGSLVGKGIDLHGPALLFSGPRYRCSLRRLRGWDKLFCLPFDGSQRRCFFPGLRFILLDLHLSDFLRLLSFFRLLFNNSLGRCRFRQGIVKR